jgi:hypothetical protein
MKLTRGGVASTDAAVLIRAKAAPAKSCSPKQFICQRPPGAYVVVNCGGFEGSAGE